MSPLGSWADAKAVFKLSLPILAASLLQVGVLTINVVFAGRLGAHYVAAVSVAESLWSIGFISINGLAVYLSSEVARLGLGAAARAEGSLLLTCGQLTALCCFIVTVIELGVVALLLPTVIDPSLVLDVRSFLLVLCLGGPFICMFVFSKAALDGLRQTQIGMRSALIAFLCNSSLSYVLAFGTFGSPPLGAIGLAWATVATWAVVCLFTVIALHRATGHAGFSTRHLFSFRTTRYRKSTISLLDGRFSALANYQRRAAAPDRDELRERAAAKTPPRKARALLLNTLRYGWPTSLSFFAESSFFHVVGLLLTFSSTEVQSAYYIALNVARLLFVPWLAIGIGSSIHYSSLISQGHIERVLPTLYKVSFAVGVASMLSGYLAYAFRLSIVHIFTGEPIVVMLTTPLFLFVGLFQILDACQTMLLSYLRSIRRTVLAFVIFSTSYWIVGLGLAIVLLNLWVSRPTMAVWTGIISSIGMSASLMLLLVITRTSGLARREACQNAKKP